MSWKRSIVIVCLGKSVFPACNIVNVKVNENKENVGRSVGGKLNDDCNSRLSLNFPG